MLPRVTVQLHPGPRLYIGGHRVHHGLVGLVLCLSDIRDARRWVSDLLRYSNR